MSITNKQTTDSTSEPINYEDELQRLEELQQLMIDFDDQMKDSFLRSEILNLDVATLFDPEDIVRAREVCAELDCKKCELDDTIREN